MSKEGELFRIGDELSLDSGELKIQAVSSKEYGKLKKVSVVAGDLTAMRESVLHEFTDFESDYSFEKSMSIGFKSISYIRMETFTDGANKPFSFTNPIWINNRS